MAKEIKFNIKLSIDGKEQLVSATSSLKDIQKSISAVNGMAGNLRNSFILFNQGVEAVGNLSGVIGTLTAESATFSRAMAEANTMAGKSGEDFARMKEQVSELAKTIPMARDELAGGLYQVISNGVPEDNWIAYLQKSAKASVGGIADLGETVKVTSTVIKNYGLSWDQAGDIQDKIQLTAKNGVTSFEQLAQALPRVTGNAATLGVSIDELMATFATLTGVSGNTNEVATQMAAVFTALVKPSGEAAKMARQMGIEFDAASIKAAGGLQNFLTQLDKSVKTYAQANGMLEQEIYGKLFGSAESLRAVGPLTGQLADTFAKNIGNMKDSAGTIDEAFATMGSTGAAQMQLLKNKWAELSDMLAEAVQPMKPYLNFGAQLGTTIAGVTSLATAVKGLAGSTKIASAAQATMNGLVKAFGPIAEVCSATMRGTAVSAQTLTLAVRGLLIASGVGLAVTALTLAIEHLSSTADEASPAADGLRQAEEASVAASAEAKTAIDGEISRLRQLIQSKQDASKTVDELNQRYGEAFGYHKTAAQWYDTLTSKSQTYIRQLGYEAQAKALASRMAENDIRLQNNYDKRRELWQKGQAQTTTVQYMGGAPGTRGTYRTARQDSDQYKALKQEGAELLQQQKDYRRQWDIVSGRLRQTAADMRAVETETTKATQATTATAKGKGKSAKGKGGTATAAKADPLEGSIDWYEKRIQDLRTRMEATADEATATALRRQMEAAEKELADLKVRIGIEAPESREVKTRLQQLRDQLDRAQADFDDAATIEAKVKADARIADLQRQIDQATRGQLTIEADVEPSYVTQGSAADRRQSYANAQQRASRIQQDYDIGIIGRDEARKQMDDLNAQITQIGLKPMKLSLETAGFDRALGDVKSAWSGVKGVAGGIEGITEALDAGGSAWQRAASLIDGFISVAEGIQAVSQIIDTLTAATTAHTAAAATDAAATAGETAAATASTAAKSGEAVAAAAASGAKMPFPLNLVAIAAGVAAVIAALSAVSRFATGGIVGGASTTGDRQLARVNSGEMILNRTQQARLFAIASGSFSPPVFTGPRLQPVATATAAGNVEPASTEVNIQLNADARRMLDMISDTKRIASRSGRRFEV